MVLARFLVERNELYQDFCKEKERKGESLVQYLSYSIDKEDSLFIVSLFDVTDDIKNK
jgi:hypothetical protein